MREQMSDKEMRRFYNEMRFGKHGSLRRKLNWVGCFVVVALGILIPLGLVLLLQFFAMQYVP